MFSEVLTLAKHQVTHCIPPVFFHRLHIFGD